MKTNFCLQLVLLSLIDFTIANEYTKVNGGLTAIPGDIPADTTQLLFSKNDITNIGTSDISHSFLQMKTNFCHRIALILLDLMLSTTWYFWKS